MKFLFITGQLNAGGAERVLLDILRHFDYEQHEVDLCQIVDGGTLADEIPSEVHRIPLWPDYTLGYKIALRLSLRCGFDFLIRKRMHDKLTKQYDVAISFLEGTPLRFHAIGRPAALRHVTWVHIDLFTYHYTATQFRDFREERDAYAKMDRVVCVSSQTKEAFDRRFPSCKSAVIYNPIDISRIHNKSKEFVVEHKEFTIVFVGRLERQKSPELLPLIANELRTRDIPVTLQIVGDGTEHSRLEESIKRLNLDNTVFLLGYQSNPYPFIAEADVLLSVSKAEGFGLVICEAMALGTPVVSTATSGPSEIIGDNLYGLLAEPSIKSICDQIQRLYEDDGLRKHFSSRGRKRAALFDIGNTMQSIYQL